MGVTINHTPKCHCKLADEGKEYSWAASKNKYRRFPVSQKKGKDQFRKLVSECLSREVVTKSLVQEFSRWARPHICAYHALHEQQQSSSYSATEEITAPLIEKLKKKSKLTVL